MVLIITFRLWIFNDSNKILISIVIFLKKCKIYKTGQIKINEAREVISFSFFDNLMH